LHLTGFLQDTGLTISGEIRNAFGGAEKVRTSLMKKKPKKKKKNQKNKGHTANTPRKHALMNF